MARFLSAEWLQTYSRAARAAPAPDSDVAPLCLQHVVRDTPDGEVRYWLRLAPDGLRAEPGPAPDPDVVVISDYEGACALHRGTMTAQELAAAGRLKVTGHVEQLRNAREILARVGDPFAELRAATDPQD